MTVAFLSPSSGYAFWHGYGDGNGMFDDADPYDMQEVHDKLLSPYMEHLANKMFVHEVPNPEEIGKVTIHRSTAFSGATLLTSFGGLCAVPALPDGSCPDEVPVLPGGPPIPGFEVGDMMTVLPDPIGGGLCKIATPVCPSPQYAKWSLLINMKGELIHSWPLVGGPVEMLPTGNVRGGHLNPTIPPFGGGLPDLVEMNWEGEPVWKWSGPESKMGGARIHHDHQAKDYAVYFASAGYNRTTKHRTNKTLVLSNHITSAAQDPAGPHEDGFKESVCPDTSEISQFPLFDDAVYEIDDITGEIVFAWYPCEHVEEMGFSDVAREGLMNYQSNPTAGLLGVHFYDAEPDAETDWMHINCVSYLGPNKFYNGGKDQRFHPDNIMIDSRTNNLIAIIARHPGQFKDKTWEAGEIVWKVGPQYGEGYEEHRLGQIGGPHMSHMIPRGLPGAGNILVFDNGGISGYGELLPGLPGYYPNVFQHYSRVLEFNPKTKRKVWEYLRPVEREAYGNYERKFYSMLISNAQRLPNGNTLICEGQTGRIFEVTKWGAIAWEYFAEFDNGLPLGPAGFLGPRPVYRAYRVPWGWVKKAKGY